MINTLQYMAYQLYFFHLFEGLIMKPCRYCKIMCEKLPYHTEVICSIQCKIKHNIKILDTECWIYKHTNSGTYAKLRWQGKWYLAHRMSYEVFTGEIPQGMLVCHSCDTPKCINPKHLFVGTHADNTKDRIAKNRSLTGEKNHFSKLTDIQREQLLILRNDGYLVDQLAKIFNVSFTQVCRILKNTKEN